MYYEYKNFFFPINDSNIRFQLKKAVCSFLNSDLGGIIFIGIVDATSKVNGVNLNF
jgi:hypothetical protein